MRSVAHSRTTVLHVNTERGWRGGERQTLLLARALAGDGWRSIVAAWPGEPLAARAREAALPAVPVAGRGELDLRAALALRSAIRDNDVDVVHAHTARALGLCALATLGTNVALVATRRVTAPLRRNAGTRWKYRRAHAIIAISEAVAAVLAAGGVPRSRIEVIADGIPLECAPRPRARAALAVPDGAPLVVMVAALTPEKDPLTFVRAVAHARARLPELRALLVGDGPLLTAARAEARALGLDNVLHATGWREDATAILAAADVVCLTSRAEGLGTVLMDAMACARPVVATAAGGIPELISHGENGLLAPPGDALAVGDAVARVLSDPALARRLSGAGRERVKEFDIRLTARRTAALYTRVLAGR